MLVKCHVLGYGTPEDGGDLDFYPGGGDPPGCEQTVARSITQDTPTESNYFSKLYYYILSIYISDS